MTKTITKPDERKITTLPGSVVEDLFPPMVLPDDFDKLKEKKPHGPKIDQFGPVIHPLEAQTDEVQPQFKNILLPMIRRIIPDVIASDIIGVQPMTEPTGMIFSDLGNHWKETKDALQEGIEKAKDFWTGVYDDTFTAAKLDAIGIAPEFMGRPYNPQDVTPKPQIDTTVPLEDIVSTKDGAVIYKAKRPEKRIFYIDVGELPKDKTKAYLEKVREDIRSRRIPKDIEMVKVDVKPHPVISLKEKWSVEFDPIMRQHELTPEQEAFETNEYNEWVAGQSEYGHFESISKEIEELKEDIDALEAGTLENPYDPLSITTDYWFPSSIESKGSRVEELPDGNTEEFHFSHAVGTVKVLPEDVTPYKANRNVPSQQGKSTITSFEEVMSQRQQFLEDVKASQYITQLNPKNTSQRIYSVEKPRPVYGDVTMLGSGVTTRVKLREE